MTIRDLFRSADNQPFRSTDYPNRPVHLRVNRTVEEVRAAARDSVRIHCGWCTGSFPDTEDGRSASAGTNAPTPPAGTSLRSRSSTPREHIGHVSL